VIQNPIHNKPDKQIELTNEAFIRMHHEFINCYGFIPMEQFAEIKLSSFFSLYPLIMEEKKKELENNHMLKVIAKSLGAKLKI